MNVTYAQTADYIKIGRYLLFHPHILDTTQVEFHQFYSRERLKKMKKITLHVGHILCWLGELCLLNSNHAESYIWCEYEESLPSSHLTGVYWRGVWLVYLTSISHSIYQICNPKHFKMKGLAIGLNDRWPEESPSCRPAFQVTPQKRGMTWRFRA